MINGNSGCSAGMAGSAWSAQPPLAVDPYAGPGPDPVEAYFECITSCSLDDGECVTTCTTILREHS